MFGDEVARVAQDPGVRRLARRWAGDSDLAADALQETCRTVTQTKNPENIHDLRAFFCKSLINEIAHQRARPQPVLVEDIGMTADLRQEHRPSPGNFPPASVESQAIIRLLGERTLRRLERDAGQLMTTIPARSEHPVQYRAAIVRAAKKILGLVLDGPVTSADWNAALMNEYPLLRDESAAQDATHQRLSRARRDVQVLLQRLITRDELAS